MDKMYRVKDVARILGCGTDTARARMAEMPGVVNVGSDGRRQLMVPEYGIEDWLRNRRMNNARPLQVMPGGGRGKTPRRDRRTGRLQAV